MADPTIDETRDGARVVVYGDSTPVTEHEWHCARLVWELYRGALVVADAGPRGFVARAGDDAHATMATYPTRCEAVAGLAKMLADEAEGKAAEHAQQARRWEQEGAALINDADRATARAARLRALLAGAP